MVIKLRTRQQEVLSSRETGKTDKIARSIFYRLNDRASSESAIMLHPRSDYFDSTSTNLLQKYRILPWLNELAHIPQRHKKY